MHIQNLKKKQKTYRPGGIPARSEKGERLLLFIGIIDILQSYRLKKKLEHTFKSIIHDGVSQKITVEKQNSQVKFISKFFLSFQGHRVGMSTVILRSKISGLYGQNRFSKDTIA